MPGGFPGGPTTNGNFQNPGTPSSGGAVGAGSAAKVGRNEQAAGVSPPAAKQRYEQNTLDQLDQKLERSSGVAPRCPPGMTNCNR
jgi:hypothetical protein